MVKVSICIPTYNRLEYLKELVESCVNQTYNDFEICISQDVTPTGLDEEIKNYCEILEKKYPKYIVYRAQKTNLGLAGNWNALVAMAKGEFVFIPGDDDLISKDFLTKTLKNENLEADVIFTNQSFIDHESKIMKSFTIEQNHYYKRDILDSGCIDEPIGLVLKNSVPMSASLIRRKWLLKFLYDPFINTPELEVFLKIAVSGGRFVFVNEQLAYFRIHLGSATNSGLTVGKYISNIIDIQVPSNYEELKLKLITRGIVPAVNNSIKKGNKKMAIKLYNSKYYPKKRLVINIAHIVLLKLPIGLSAFLLNLRDK